MISGCMGWLCTRPWTQELEAKVTYSAMRIQTRKKETDGSITQLYLEQFHQRSPRKGSADCGTQGWGFNTQVKNRSQGYRTVDVLVLSHGVGKNISI
jgi:hypothetical protein